MLWQYARVQSERHIAADSGDGNDKDNKGFGAKGFHDGFQSKIYCKEYLSGPGGRMFACPHIGRVRALPLGFCLVKRLRERALALSLKLACKIVEWRTDKQAHARLESNNI
jgi:hypothetical protein